MCPVLDRRGGGWPRYGVGVRVTDTPAGDPIDRPDIAAPKLTRGA